jgi:putative protease
MTRTLPELLLPAGDLHKLKIAYLYGADAAYCGVPRFSLRARENEISIQNLQDAVAIARSMGKRIYFTINAIPRNSKIASFPKYLTQMAELKPDGFIMADPGLMMIAREMHPEIPLHISVQANTMNYATVKFWQSIGAKRVILSREVSIPEVAEIKKQVPDMELEVFVHGAICIAHSGRCFMSNYFKGRDANQGACNNACRDEYKVYVTNPKQNDEMMELIEDSDGTFLMNSKDLRAISYLQEIIDAGVDSIKVEGRTKNDFYVAMVARTYRKALDDIRDGKPFDPNLLIELDKLSNRGYFTGFLTRGLDDKETDEETSQNLESGRSVANTHVYAGCVHRYDADTKTAWFEIKSKISLGDELEVFFPGEYESRKMIVTEMTRKDKPMEVLSGGMGEVGIKTSFPIPENSFLINPIPSESKILQPA